MKIIIAITDNQKENTLRRRWLFAKWSTQQFLWKFVCFYVGHKMSHIGGTGHCDPDGTNFKPDSKIMQCCKCSKQIVVKSTK